MSKRNQRNWLHIQIIIAVLIMIPLGGIMIWLGLENFGMFAPLIAALATPSEETLKKWFSNSDNSI